MPGAEFEIPCRHADRQMTLAADRQLASLSLLLPVELLPHLNRRDATCTFLFKGLSVYIHCSEHKNFHFVYRKKVTYLIPPPMHHYIWVYWDQLDANCLVLFYYTFFAGFQPDTAWNGSTHTCTYLYQLHVHYMTLLRMDVYYIRNM